MWPRPLVATFLHRTSVPQRGFAGAKASKNDTLTTEDPSEGPESKKPTLTAEDAEDTEEGQKKKFES